MLPWQHFFSVSWTHEYFMGSLLSIPLHRLELISFSATPGNNCCHGNSFFLFPGLKNLSCGSLHSKPLHTLELISFSTSAAMATVFFLFLGLMFLWVLCIPNPCINRSWLAFQQYLAASAVPQNGACPNH